MNLTGNFFQFPTWVKNGKFVGYRKRPCTSRTFFHKIEAINQGCGLSMDTSVFGVLKNLINIRTTS